MFGVYAHLCFCVCVFSSTHNGTGFCDEEELSEGSVKRQQHCDASGILAQAVFHRHKELPQRSQQCQLTGSRAQTNQQTDKHMYKSRTEKIKSLTIGETKLWLKLNFIYLPHVNCTKSFNIQQP